MLESRKIELRRSEVRQELAILAAKTEPTEDELRKMESLDLEYRGLETRLRAALIGEDEERRAAGAELETREGRAWSDLVGAFEVRQIVAALDHGHQITGRTAEAVQEMRSQGQYTGIPVPLEALELRNTVAANVPDPTATRPIFDRLFPASVAARLGVNSISIPQGSVEYPVTTQGASAAWATSEGGNVGSAVAFQTTEATLSPDHTLGTQMRISRKAAKQGGPGLETAIRRDMAAAIGAALDLAILTGDGEDGVPEGLLEEATGTGTWAATWATVRAEVVAFMEANAISDPQSVRMAITPAMWAALDGAYVLEGDPQAGLAGPAMTEWQRLTGGVGAPALATQLPANTALLAVTAGGLSPAYLGIWGGLDVIRDPYSDAHSGGLRLTGLLTVDLVVPRPIQLRKLVPAG